MSLVNTVLQPLCIIIIIIIIIIIMCLTGIERTLHYSKIKF